MLGKIGPNDSKMSYTYDRYGGGGGDSDCVDIYSTTLYHRR